ncbi:MAG: STAS domain-containing protein [Victivallaceae bacterium]
MKRADLLIAHNKGVYNIKVEGRANFEYGLPLRDFAKNLEGKFEKISIDLKSCTGMDSTFMGVLAMIGLKSRKAGAVVEIVNADANNRHLLIGLGLEKLFAFVDQQETPENAEWQQSEAGKDQLTTAETVVEAHQTLMDIDQNNVPKFEKVVEFAQEDLDKLKKSSQ